MLEEKYSTFDTVIIKYHRMWHNRDTTHCNRCGSKLTMYNQGRQCLHHQYDKEVAIIMLIEDVFQKRKEELELADKYSKLYPGIFKKEIRKWLI